MELMELIEIKPPVFGSTRLALVINGKSYLLTSHVFATWDSSLGAKTYRTYPSSLGQGHQIKDVHIKNINITEKSQTVTITYQQYGWNCTNGDKELVWINREQRFGLQEVIL
ncbi:MAG: hypothetical protein NVS2B14_00210 [Chamaesiphon sp.]